jgi:hypothetical protein
MRAIAKKSVLLIPSFISFAAVAADIRNDTKITIDLQGRQVQFYGVYAPGTANSRVQGLEAEIAARRNGITHLNSFLNAQCGSAQSEQSGEKAAFPSWQGAVKSQGSEIFANGVLKISLVAPLKDVLKDTAKKKSIRLKTNDGTSLALRFPKVPARALKCGLVSLNVGGRTIELNPLSVTSEAGAKIVNLALDGAQLKPAGSADLALLENSNLIKMPDGGHSDSAVSGSPVKSEDSSANPSSTQSGQTAEPQKAN